MSPANPALSCPPEKSEERPHISYTESSRFIRNKQIESLTVFFKKKGFLFVNDRRRRTDGPVTFPSFSFVLMKNTQAKEKFFAQSFFKRWFTFLVRTGSRKRFSDL
jgi:hypothetical protein